MKTNEITEAELRAKFDELVRTEYSRMLAIPIAFGYPYDECNDIVQEALLSSWKYRHSYDKEKGASLYTWITNQVKMICSPVYSSKGTPVASRRRPNPHRGLFQIYGIDEVEEMESNSENPEGKLMYAEMMARIYTTLTLYKVQGRGSGVGTIGYKNKYIVLNHMLSGTPTNEIAQDMHISITSVSNYKREIIEELRRAME